MHTAVGLVTTAAAVFSGLLAGASLDQSIKQLPARHKIGLSAYSRYSRASDLGNGIFFYSILGAGVLVTSLAAGVLAFIFRAGNAVALPLYIGVGLAIMHSLLTTRAAPLNFSQRKVAEDNEDALRSIIAAFAKWQAGRCVLQVLNFGVYIWAMLAFVRQA